MRTTVSILFIVVCASVFSLCQARGFARRGYLSVQPNPYYDTERSHPRTFKDVFFRRNYNWNKGTRLQGRAEGDEDNAVDCGTANYFPSYINGWSYGETIRTEGQRGAIGVEEFQSIPYLQIIDCDMECDYPFRTVILSQRTRPDGCNILDVTIGIESETRNDCQLALLNGVIHVSCPPDEIAMEYRQLSLHPVVWKDAAQYQNIFVFGETGYIICGMRDVDQCPKPALFVSVDLEKIKMTSYVVPYTDA